MSIVMLVVGLLATAAGFVTIGFGIPINAFSLGNTLIIAGTIGVAAGLILIGLGSAIGQLRRIAEALNGRPLARGARSAETVEAMVPPTARMTPAAPPSPVPTRMPAQPKPPELRESPFPDLRALEPDLPDQRMHEPEMPDLRGLEPELPDLHQAEPPREPAPRPPAPAPRPSMPRPPLPRQPEPRFPVTASEPQPGPLDWLRAKSKPAASAAAPAAAMPPSAPETPMVDIQDEAPLSPRPPQRQAMPAESALEPKVWSPSRAGGAAEPRSSEIRPSEIRPAPRVEQPMPRATPQPEPPKDKDDFDFVWPERNAPAAEPARREAHVDMPLPPIPTRPRELRPAPSKPAAERGPTILKSGVIDGMPYTLYADGSIEAELPQGTVKFASVDALRAHLEKQS